MTGADRSLLTFLDAPVVVGDPDGRCVFVNPAFEQRFRIGREAVMGVPLAELFEGGAREAVLRAVASVCQYGESVRFRLREGEVGFAAVASPILAEKASVGVVILLKEEIEGLERLLSLHRKIQDPLDRLSRVFDSLHEQTGGRRGDAYRGLVEEGQGALGGLRQWADELKAMISGSGESLAGGETFDAAEVLREVASRAAQMARGRQTRIALLSPASLPPLRGEAQRLSGLLLRAVRDRIEDPQPPASLTLGGRALDGGGGRSVLLSITERAPGGGYTEVQAEAALLQEAVAALGGSFHVTPDPQLGRCTVLRFPMAE